MDPAPDDPQPASPGRPRLDRRTILVCVAIAGVAAVITFVLLVAGLSDDGPSTAAATSTSVKGGSTTTDTLQRAKRAPVSTKVTRFDGSELKLSDFKGQKLVVNFFASTCIPCKKEMPALQKVHERLGDDVTFIGVAVQDDPDDAQALIKRTGVSYDLAQDPSGTLFQRFGGVVLPMTAFVDEEGTVIKTHTGAYDEQDMTQAVSDYLLAGG